MSSSIDIIYIVRNGGKYIRFFLNSLKNQTLRQSSGQADFEVIIWDNNSTDNTREIIKKEYPEFKLHESSENIGVWAAFEKFLETSTSKYIMCMTDIILKVNFIEKALEIMEANPGCGALQAKIYQMELYGKDEPIYTNKIDTLGFQLFKSRKVINLGQGEEDRGQYDNVKEIFGAEGAAPVFRRDSLEDCRMSLRNLTPKWLIDPNFRVGPFGYGDDLDLAWRMRLLGWNHLLALNVIAYHDRSTTKGFSKSAKNYLSRIKERQKIDMIKRRLDWRNIRWTIIKNDYIINILKDLPWILTREIGVLGYTLLFEPTVLAEISNFMKYLPKMLLNRKAIMAKAKVGPAEMRQWFK